ncbi:metallophosphoesterase family protein [Actinocorallia populi]|uniref:metallophosphoesterase family protein n=1 Tax=Actinocorallia populi TaxID=2079200 RepID=UPI000D08EA40|nr:metallophosphoesterase [Actinocorallia populi]
MKRLLHRLFNRRTARWSSLVLIGVAGALAGLLLGGRIQTPVGPADASLSFTLAWDGGTVVDVPPLGSIRLDSHSGPVVLKAQISQLRPADTESFINDPSAIDALSQKITDQLRHGLVWMAVRGALTAFVLAFVLALLVHRAWRPALAALTAAAVTLSAFGAAAWLTFRPSSVAEPRYTGLLANAPQLVGDVQTVVQRFDEYRGMLAKLVGNVSELYATTSTLPIYEPDPSTLRVLHVSDIHLNPIAWDVIRSITTQFKVEVIIDSGDLTDHGSRAEDRFTDNIETLGDVPYVFVRGNHDSPGTQEAVARNKNAVVLDNETKTVEGLRIYGAGDPRFTPDKTTADDSLTPEALFAEGTELAAPLRTAPEPPHVAVIHDGNQAKAFDGATPLVLSGHSHRRATELLPQGTRLFVQGSTGGAGLRSLEHETPTNIELSLLYFNRETLTLQAWDDFTLGGLGEQSVQVERHLTSTPPTAATPTAPATTPASTPTNPPPTP